MTASVASGQSESGPIESDSAAPPLESSNAAAKRTRAWPARIWKIGVFFWKYLVGVLLCQSFLGSIFVVGWSFRLMQRTALRRWWKASPLRQSGTSFEDFLHQSHNASRHWPNWVFGPRRVQNATDSRLREYAHAVGGSLWQNARIGVQATVNTWVLTMPACVLWLVAWYAGWDNSFNKGYEQAFVGPIVGWLGILWFMAVMCYVPVAQARQGATGDWRTFYAFRFMWKLITTRSVGCLMLAVYFTLLSLPVSILKTAPAFFPQGNPAFEDASDAEILSVLSTYFLWSTIAVLACFVLIKIASSRTYAAAVVSALRSGRLHADQLHPAERLALDELGLLDAASSRSRHILIRTASGTARWFKAVGMGLATLIVWFTFVSQIYVSEFFNYHPVDTVQGHFLGGWLNQPLVQLPWFNYVPADLKQRVEGTVTEVSAAHKVWNSATAGQTVDGNTETQRSCGDLRPQPRNGRNRSPAVESPPPWLVPAVRKVDKLDVIRYVSQCTVLSLGFRLLIGLRADEKSKAEGKHEKCRMRFTLA